ncbi:helicase-related protein [Calditerricola satsumensis]
MAHPCWLYAVDLGDGRLTLRWTPVPEADLAYWAQRGAVRLVWARRPVTAREAWEAVQGGADPRVAADGVSVSGLRPEAGRGEATGLAFLRRAARAARLARLAERVAARLAGRSLLWTELMALADRRAWGDLWGKAAVARGDGVRAVQWAMAHPLLAAAWRAPLRERHLLGAVQWLVLEGRAELVPGVAHVGEEPPRGWRRKLARLLRWGHTGRPAGRCLRCGEEETLQETPTCASCGAARCAFCARCLAMGKSRSCALLVRVGAPALGPGREVGVPAALVLSPVQAGAARAARAAADAALAALRARVQGSDRPLASRELLLWAVCGAGKTEMVYPAMAEVLRGGGRVLVATPRRDVVQELVPRLARDFAGVRVVGQYGGSPETWASGDIVVATTHQCLRWRGAFALVIVDEVDAFPFHRDPMLPRAVAQALAPGGCVLYLSATPPRDLLFRVRRGEVAVVRVPVRHHGHPLPEPQLVRASRLLPRVHAGRPVPEVLVRVGATLAAGRRLFCFVPRVEDVPGVVAYLRRFAAERNWPVALPHGIDGTHATDPRREAVVRAFREGTVRVVVTTTILERGVTVPHADCLVLGADHAVFDEAALVQIAGRVGRAADDPTGRVWFVAERPTAAQRQARAHIREMNRLGRRYRTKT